MVERQCQICGLNDDAWFNGPVLRQHGYDAIVVHAHCAVRNYRYINFHASPHVLKHVSILCRFQLFSPNQELGRGLEENDLLGVSWRSIRNTEAPRAKLLVSFFTVKIDEKKDRDNNCVVVSQRCESKSFENEIITSF